VITSRENIEDDWKAICRVHNLAWPDKLFGSCDERPFVPLAEDPEAADIHRSHKLVTCEGERVVGFIGVDGTPISYPYVDSEHYGRGIGRRLLRLGVGLTGPAAHTTALAAKARAIVLFESEGFKLVRTFDGENAGYPRTCVRLELGSKGEAKG
jgi:GNAT superfamily N-acetyltransferase